MRSLTGAAAVTPPLLPGRAVSLRITIRFTHRWQEEAALNFTPQNWVVWQDGKKTFRGRRGDLVLGSEDGPCAGTMGAQEGT